MTEKQATRKARKLVRKMLDEFPRARLLSEEEKIDYVLKSLPLVKWLMWDSE